MYKEHPIFILPDRESRIWRYVDLSKLISFISTQSLFFARADKFEDPFEGALPNPNVEKRRRDLEVNPDQLLNAFREGGTHMSIEDARNLAAFAAAQMESYYSNENSQYRKFTYINCWHVNEDESYAMWGLYSRSHEAIAIQSTFERLTHAFDQEDRDVYVGKVHYTNYENELIPEGSDFIRFLTKRKSFSHDSELRAIHREEPAVVKNQVDYTPYHDHGISLKVGVSELVERLVLSPSAPSWFEDMVRSVVDRYDVKFEITRSRLDTAPRF